MKDDAALSPADAILIARAQRDLEEGIQYKIERIRQQGHPFITGAIEAAANGAIGAIRLRERYREDVAFVLGLARRAHHGEDPKKLADEHVERIMRVRELALAVRVKDPAFRELVARNRDFLARRLPDLGRMACVPDPVDYVDIVRRAFPDRKMVDGIIAENAAFVNDLIDFLLANPQLLRVPRSWMPKLEQVGRDIVDWQVQRVGKALDEIYA